MKWVADEWIQQLLSKDRMIAWNEATHPTVKSEIAFFRMVWVVCCEGYG